MYLCNFLSVNLSPPFTAQIEDVGDTPLRRLLEALGGWPVADEGWNPGVFVLEEVLGDLRRKYNTIVLVDVWISPDDKNSSANILQVRCKKKYLKSPPP